MIRTIVLPTGTTTTCIGFGCSLNGGRDAKASRKLVETALASGIRHFDVAPSYGGGMAEEILGDVLQGSGVQVTITTKVGIGRPANRRALAAVRSVVVPLKNYVPRVWSGVSRAVRVATQPASQFEPAKVRQEFSQSLKLLRRDYIDLYLMHEMQSGQNTPELAALLREFKREGRVGACGVASSYEAAQQISSTSSELGTVWQFPWSVLDEPLSPAEGHFTVVHGAIKRAHDALYKWLSANRPLALDMSKSLGYDLLDSDALAVLLFAASLGLNPSGIALVFSRRPERIEQFAQAAARPDIQELSKRFYQALRIHLPSSYGRVA